LQRTEDLDINSKSSIDILLAILGWLVVLFTAYQLLPYGIELFDNIEYAINYDYYK
jgi:hypothetical protein